MYQLFHRLSLKFVSDGPSNIYENLVRQSEGERKVRMIPLVLVRLISR